MLCFSMRFVVLIDLISTLVSPVTVAYVGYLIYLIGIANERFPLTAIIMIAAIYGLQAIIFIIRGRFEMVGWLVIVSVPLLSCMYRSTLQYILAIPIFAFAIPLYSFWHMDSFSWGSTRQIKGERGKRMLAYDEGYFDPAEIPMRTWADHEEDLWERGSNQSIGSIIEHGIRPGHEHGSIYGFQMESPTQSRAATPHAFPTSTPPLMDFAEANNLSFPFRSSVQQSAHGEYSSASHQSFASSLSFDNNFQAPPPMPRAAFGTMPSDEQIAQDVQALVMTVDVNTTSKKQLRAQLAKTYGLTDMGIKTMRTNDMIEEAVELL